MKEYAVFQTLRNIFIILFIVIMVIMKLPGQYLTLSFLMSEFLLFIITVIYAIKSHYIKIEVDRDWVKEHFRYGFKIMPGNLVLELNARMDVMILGWFLSDAVVGVYYFALRFAEGFYQLLVVVRRNINPVIARNVSKKDFTALGELKGTLSKYSKYLIPASAVFNNVCVLRGGLFDRRRFVGVLPACNRYAVYHGHVKVHNVRKYVKPERLSRTGGAAQYCDACDKHCAQSGFDTDFGNVRRSYRHGSFHMWFSLLYYIRA